MLIGEIIRKVRKAKGISQMKLAGEIGITYQQLQKYENGKSKITVERLIDIAKALKIPAYLFLVEENNEIRKFSNEEAILLELFSKVTDKDIREAFIKILIKLTLK
jgi:Helix-turn-helix.